MKKRFNGKRFISLSLVLIFIALLISGTVLFIMPHGRIAYWLNWKIMGINKTGWETLHTVFAFLFIISGILHLAVYNWKIFLSYLKRAKDDSSLLNKELALSLVFFAVFTAGSLLNIPPFSSFMDMGESIKKSWISKDLKPPFPHAELMSVKELCEKERIDLKGAMGRLKAAGIPIKGSKQRIAFVARDSNLSARDIFLVIKGTKKQ